VDDHGTPAVADDTLASFSAFGNTQDGFAKPDLVAPGVNLVSTLGSPNETLAQQHPDHKVKTDYFRMSGTSMAAPVVSGAAALLLQTNPSLTPDQVKYRLVSMAEPVASNVGVGAGEVNAFAAANSASTKSANSGVVPSALFTSIANSVNGGTQGSMSWGSMSWGSMSWGSVSWGSAIWASDYWGS
jgi:serine protease AprX